MSGLEGATSAERGPEAPRSQLTVGVVGLGRMGGPIARNLVDAGFAVIGFDLDGERVRELEMSGGAGADTPGDVAQAEIVITSLPSERALADVLHHLAERARSGQVVIEASTLSVAAKQRARAAVAPAGAVLIDCPLSGTGHQALHRDLVVLASGDEAAVRRCAPVFEGFARAHHYLGGFGAGTRMKFVANLLVAIHNVAASEALVLAKAAGLDQELALRVLCDSAGSSRMLEVRGPSMLAGRYESGVSHRVFQKDLGLIREFAAEHSVPTPLFAASSELHLAAMASGLAELDTASVYEVLKTLAGGFHLTTAEGADEGE